jgi:hypothetical protein
MTVGWLGAWSMSISVLSPSTMYIRSLELSMIYPSRHVRPCTPLAACAVLPSPNRTYRLPRPRHSLALARGRAHPVVDGRALTKQFVNTCDARSQPCIGWIPLPTNRRKPRQSNVPTQSKQGSPSFCSSNLPSQRFHPARCAPPLWRGYIYGLDRGTNSLQTKSYQ